MDAPPPPRSGRIGELPTIPSSNNISNLIVIRSNDFSGSANNYYIVLDGNIVFAINTGEYTEFKVKTGDHTIGVMCFGGWSPTWKIDSQEFSAPLLTTSYFLISSGGECSKIKKLSLIDGVDWVAKSTYISTDNLAEENINNLGNHIYKSWRKSDKNLDTNLAIAGALVSGVTQAALTPGNSTYKAGAGLLAASQSMLNSANTYNNSNYDEDSDYSSTYNSISSNDLETAVKYCKGRPLPRGESCNYDNESIATAPTSSSGYKNPNCPSNFSHLSAEMPRFTDPDLSEIRQSILDTSMSEIVSGAKRQGMTQEQTINMAMRQAEEFENTAMQNSKAAADMSTYLKPRDIVTGVNRGRLSLSLSCGGSTSMVAAAKCAVIQQVWGAMANREIAKYIPDCW